MPGFLYNSSGRKRLHSWGVGCPGFDRWAVQADPLPRPAWRRHVIIWEWFPGKAWFLTHTGSASAGLLGSLACKEGPQIGGRERKSVSSQCEMTQNQTVGAVSHILNTFYPIYVQLVFFKPLKITQTNKFFL